MRENSVQKKIREQIQALNDLGLSTTGIFFTSDMIQSGFVAPSHVQFVPIPETVGNWFRSIRERRIRVNSLLEWAKQNAAEYNIFYVRNAAPNRRWFRFIRLYRDKIITEHQTKEIDQIKALLKENPLGIKPGKFLSWMEYSAIPLLNEWVFGSLSLGKVKNLVAVTSEIAEYEKQRACFGIPNTYTVTNGIDTHSCPLRTSPEFTGKEIHLLMLVGGSTAVDWHGIDLIVGGIRNYKGPVHIVLHLAGEDHLLNQYQDDFIIRHGYCNAEAIDKLADICHLALGTFAFQRKGLNEASTLKMREYAARGIPAVYAHTDPDYTGLVTAGLALHLTPMQVPDMAKVIQFAENLYRDSLASIKIRNYAIANMDFQVKMKELSEILLKIK
ncbi:MAG: hypothetical protein JNL57_01015 [Bacteroidetes bacterium]|nr:hypothetical protein [Bacteroidota bacterium]